MRRPPLNGMYSAALAIGLTLCLPLTSANAEDLTENAGGDGGTPFQVACPQGQFIVGLFGFTGQIVDGIGMMCAPWLNEHTSGNDATTGNATQGEYFGGKGANHVQMLCPPGSALGGWVIDPSTGLSPKVVGSIEAEECHSLADSNNVVSVENAFFGTRQKPSGAFGAPFITAPFRVGCPAGELANGLFGGSGVFLDRVGLMCAPPLPPKLIRCCSTSASASVSSPTSFFRYNA
jgi:hypothetical protein